MTTSRVIASSSDEKPCIRIPAMTLLRGGGQRHAAQDQQKCGRENAFKEEREGAPRQRKQSSWLTSHPNRHQATTSWLLLVEVSAPKQFTCRQRQKA